jgi:AraC-like DNA-binding protein
MLVYTAAEFMRENGHIHIEKTSATNHALHTHEFIEIVYVMSGKMTHEIDGREYRVREGDVLFMNCGCTHAFRADSPCTFVNILFASERINKELFTPTNALPLLLLTSFDDMRKETNAGKLSFLGAERKEVEDIVSAMLREYAAKQISYETVLENYLNTLIVKMIRRVEIGIRPDDLSDVWQSLAAFIDGNLDSKLSGNALAQKFFYNPSYFSRVFKEKFGMPFVEYITRKRLSYAIELLKNTELSVEEIGRRVGFSDVKGLYRAFSTYLGSTPSQYRTKT